MGTVVTTSILYMYTVVHIFRAHRDPSAFVFFGTPPCCRFSKPIASSPAALVARAWPWLSLCSCRWVGRARPWSEPTSSAARSRFWSGRAYAKVRVLVCVCEGEGMRVWRWRRVCVCVCVCVRARWIWAQLEMWTHIKCAGVGIRLHALPVPFIPELCLFLRLKASFHQLALFLGVLVLLVRLIVVEPSRKNEIRHYGVVGVLGLAKGLRVWLVDRTFCEAMSRCCSLPQILWRGSSVRILGRWSSRFSWLRGAKPRTPVRIDWAQSTKRRENIFGHGNSHCLIDMFCWGTRLMIALTTCFRK